jgi:5-methylcytosine-specific restriction endonuclease McrA
MTNFYQSKLYDKYKRNKVAKKFYNSAAWKKCRGLILLRDNYLCQECLSEGQVISADMVHHIKSFDDHPEFALDMDNLISICHPCHNKEHPEKGSGKIKKQRRFNVVKVKANRDLV